MDVARQIVPPDLSALTQRYAEITLPTLLLWGRGDRVVPLAVGERLAREMPEARLHVLEACGHLPAEECPDESFSVLTQFLADTSSDRPGRLGQRIST
jgi:pimeloyl-ACP methyl ester carboxylesterase